MAGQESTNKKQTKEAREGSLHQTLKTRGPGCYSDSLSSSSPMEASGVAQQNKHVPGTKVMEGEVPFIRSEHARLLERS